MTRAVHGAIQMQMSMLRKVCRRCARNGSAIAAMWKKSKDVPFRLKTTDIYRRSMLRSETARGQVSAVSEEQSFAGEAQRVRDAAGLRAPRNHHSRNGIHRHSGEWQCRGQ